MLAIKVSCTLQDTNPGGSSPWPSHYRLLAAQFHLVLQPRRNTRFWNGIAVAFTANSQNSGESEFGGICEKYTV